VVAATTAAEPSASWRSDDDGVDHRVWVLDDPAGIGSVVRTLAHATVVIADGHHRFQTALDYRTERRAVDGPGPWDAMLLYLVDADWFGPALLPIHRAIDVPPDEVRARLAGAFEIETADGSDPEALAAELAVRRGRGRSYALLGNDGAWWLTVADKAVEADAMPADRSPTWRDLDVAVLERLVLGKLLGGARAGYVHTATEVAGLLARGEAASGLLLAPPPFEAVRAVAEAHESMPSKSTFFVPKPRSGVVIRPLD